MWILRLLPFAIAASAGAVPAEVAAPEPASLFRDHAVLQCDKPVPIWGHAAPGEHVVVSFGGQAVGATAGADGRWIIVLAPLAAAPQGADLTIAGAATARIHDVAVGEVWLCAGQEGMQHTVDWPLGRVDGAEAASARNPLIRHFLVDRAPSDAAPKETGGGWTPCSPQAVARFCAVGYFFARDLASRLGVPIGIIDCSQAGTPIEAWMSPASLGALAAIPAGRAGGATAPGPAGWPPASAFNALVDPLSPYAIRGALWYQGEADVGRAADYAVRFPAMIREWRSLFGQGDFPFFWVQLEGRVSPAEAGGDRWASLREAQSKALSIPMTGEAVSLDLGQAAAPNPGSLREIGRRLALIAKAKVYSIPVDFSGPVYSGIEPEGSALRVNFTFAGDGLTAADRPLQSFEVAGPDRVFHAAKAAIEGDAVLVQSAAVKAPVAVRYAWRDAPFANLYNGAGLPAAPFRSDDW
jgi:sialate O-acetylesterase